MFSQRSGVQSETDGSVRDRRFSQRMFSQSREFSQRSTVQSENVQSEVGSSVRDRRSSQRMFSQGSGVQSECSVRGREFSQRPTVQSENVQSEVGSSVRGREFSQNVQSEVGSSVRDRRFSQSWGPAHGGTPPPSRPRDLPAFFLPWSPRGVQRREACVTSPCGKRSQYRACPVTPALFMGHAQDTPRSGKQRQVSVGASSGPGIGNPGYILRRSREPRYPGCRKTKQRRQTAHAQHCGRRRRRSREPGYPGSRKPKKGRRTVRAAHRGEDVERSEAERPEDGEIGDDATESDSDAGKRDPVNRGPLTYRGNTTEGQEGPRKQELRHVP
ncbi:hypothetical protein NDU88_000002 [Pleurodeles waltl]|uniref:Uncharacterized protein n=1 Tax=Pleurodeles waltl TaxID=8319 RepID=A0AAV7MNF1_PLEWA|nr:hypothetical protein NDU88_000002 [Pleurodeles waltl]